VKFFLFFSCIFSIVNGELFGQNLVPNGNFEKLINCPNTLSQLYVYNWNNAVGTSTADVFSTCIHKTALSHPEILDLSPFEGNSYVGLKPAAKKNGYREYIFTKLSQRLKKGRQYRVRMALAIPNEADYRVNHLDVLFTDFPLSSDSELTPIIESPSLTFDLSTVDSLSHWYVFEGTFTAAGNEFYLFIGNFQTLKKRDLIPIKTKSPSGMPKLFSTFAYTCIDNVVVEDMSKPATKETVVQVPIKQDEISVKSPEIPIVAIKDSVVFDNLLFETGSAQLKAKEIPELDEFAKFVLAHPDLKLIVEGHTDDVGNKNANLLLSKNRALSVMDYLVRKGIDKQRFKCIGFGSDRPIALNSNEEGRAKNRRVVINFQK
jgi:outer membrane protein OmpA-like peptidoglycan-associated protein